MDPQHGEEQQQPAPQAESDHIAIDPVCGMQVDKATARFTATYEALDRPWQTFYFCSEMCKHLFEGEPELYAQLPF
jgi:YHS domain-containing protein